MNVPLNAPAVVSGAPAKCQNCGFSSRHSRQKHDEIPLYVKCCNAFMCAGCRKLLKCVKPSEPSIEARARYDLQAAVPPNDGIYARVPEDVYHGDRASLSSTGVKLLTPPSVPALFRQAMDEPEKPKKHYDFGHAAHKMALGEGGELFVLDPEIHGRTKEGAIAQKPSATSKWKEAEGKARKLGKTCITKAEMEIAQVAAGRIHAHPLAGRLLQNGTAEMSGYWHDDTTGVRCRFRPDYMPKVKGRPVCVDCKFMVSADPNVFRRKAGEFGYHQSAAWYLDGLREVQIADDAAFLFIVVQKTPPFLVSVVQLEPEAIELGRRQNRRALDLYAECIEKNKWPGYDEGIHTVGLSPWLMKELEESLAPLEGIAA